MFEALGMVDSCFSDIDCQNFLNDNKEADIIDVEITSPGGSVEMGFRIHDMLIGSGKVINTIAYKVDSIATVIFLAGSTRLIAENCTPLVHNPMISLRDGVMLNAMQLDELKSETLQVQKQLLDFYSQKLSLDKEGKSSMQDLMDKNSPISAKEFLKLGFATDIIRTNMSVKPSVSKAYNLRMVSIANENNLIENKSIKNKMEKEFSALKNTMTNIAKALGFKAMEDGSIVKEVKAIMLETTDGTVLYTDSDAIEINVTKVFTDEALTVPAVDGDYVTIDGDTISVMGGVVSNYIEMEAQKVADLEIANAKIDEQTKTIEALKAENEKLTNDYKSKFEALTTTYNAFLAVVPGSAALSQHKPIAETFQAQRLREMREARTVGNK